MPFLAGYDGIEAGMVDVEEAEEKDEKDENGDTEGFLDAWHSLALLSIGYIFSASSFFGSKPL